MNRRKTITSGIAKKDAGIEIAPWFAPLAAKREGYNVKVLDVFGTQELLERAREDPAISDKSYHLIEDVDFVGSATEIGGLVPSELHGTFDYIVSSHNFEHLPNPIKFLQGCQSVLKPGGLISMAVPDRRGCFDYFRPHTNTGDWLEAYFEDRKKPSPKQIFDLQSCNAAAIVDGRELGAFFTDTPLATVRTTGDILSAFHAWQSDEYADVYKDAHCTVMSPASLELMLIECRYLGLISLDIESISAPVGCEFYVRLRNRSQLAPPASINETRTALMRQILAERTAQLTGSPPIAQNGAPAGENNVRDITDILFGKKMARSFRAWNHRRAQRK
jgi:SAM-dependent methyltransferase